MADIEPLTKALDALLEGWDDHGEAWTFHDDELTEADRQMRHRTTRGVVEAYRRYKAELARDAWNRDNPTGVVVDVKRDDGEVMRTRTRSSAYVDSNGHAR